MSLEQRILERQLSARCSCGASSWRFHAVALAALPIRNGRSAGPYRWLVTGPPLLTTAFRISCASCGRATWERDDDDMGCPRCWRRGGLKPALEACWVDALPTTCACGSTELTAQAHVPMAALGERGGLAAPESTVEPRRPGFHLQRVTCDRCETVLVVNPKSCPVCSD